MIKFLLIKLFLFLISVLFFDSKINNQSFCLLIQNEISHFQILSKFPYQVIVQNILKFIFYLDYLMQKDFLQLLVEFQLLIFKNHL